MSKKTVWFLLAASILLMIASAFNIGLFRALIGIPFLLAAIGCIRALGLRNPWGAYVPVMVIAVLAIVFNVALLNKQSWLFPILQDGYVEVVHDAYCYHDGRFFTCYDSESEAKGLKDMLSKNALREKNRGEIVGVHVGDRYKIVEIIFGEGDFSSAILLRTDQGFDIGGSDYESVYSVEHQFFQPSKPIISYFLAVVNTPLTAVIPTIPFLL